ncbi:MAG: SEC-C metal-binding domain-containing protein [Myxococcales bacterium]
MQTYILKAVPREFPDCTRVFEIGADQSLLSLHEAIGREFDCRSEQPHAFFMSGDFYDLASVLGGTSAGAGSTGNVRLSSLELSKGMRFAYTFDFEVADGLYLEVIDFGETEAGETYPRVVSREGELPDPDELMAGSQACHCGCCGEERDDAEDDCDCGGDGGDEASDCESSECDCTGCDHGDDACCEHCDDCEDVHPRDCDCGACRKSRLARAEFDAAQIERLEKALEAWEGEDEPDAELVFAGIEAAVALCPTSERLERLATAMGMLVEVWAGPVISFLRGKIPAKRLLAVSEGFLKVAGKAFDTVAHATILADVGKAAEALELIDAFEATSPFERDLLVVERASIQRNAGQAKEAEAALRGLLSRRWLSFELRERCIEELNEIFCEAGRQSELYPLISAEEALLEKNDALRRGVVKNGPRVAANDKCPCGSGRKYKRCCGLAA